MGTFYSLHSRFTARKDVTDDMIRSWLVNYDKDHSQGSVLADAKEELCLSGRKEGRTVVALEWEAHSSYGVATALDEEWIELVKGFADFRKGPVVAESSGEDYIDGPYTWYVGPEVDVLNTQLAEIRREVAELTKNEKRLEGKLRNAGKQVIWTL